MLQTEEPPAPRALPPEHREAMREMLVEHARARLPWWRRHTRGAAVGAGAMALVLAGGAASAYVAFKPASDTHSVYCYSVASLDGGEQSRTRLAQASASSPGSSASEASPVTKPVAACASLWRQGVLVKDSDLRPDAAGTRSEHQVPPLVACTLDEGVAAVFPGGPQTCEELGLPRDEDAG